MMRRTYGGAVGCAVAGLPCAVVAAVWLVGDQSYSGRVQGGLDYTFGPWPLSPTTIAACGVLGVLGLLVAAGVVWPIRGPRISLAYFAGSGALLGGMYRTMTAGVIGFNFGAGFAVFFLTPIVLALVIAGTVIAIRNRPARTPSHSQPSR